MKDDDKYGDSSIFVILALVAAIVLTLVFGWEDDTLPKQDQIDASPFETNGFEKSDDF